MGLTEQQCWGFTPREVSALNEQRRNYLMLWAVERADYRNVHFKGEHGEIHWNAEEILGGSAAKPEAKKIHPNVQRALIDHAMGVMPDWIDKLKDAQKQ